MARYQECWDEPWEDCWDEKKEVCHNYNIRSCQTVPNKVNITVSTRATRSVA